MGCALTAVIDGENVTVTGNQCPRGAEYGVMEVKAPMRTLTSSVRVEGGMLPLVSVKTRTDIPKGSIPAVMAAIHGAAVRAPVKLGDVIVPDAGGTGVDIVATKDVAQK